MPDFNSLKEEGNTLFKEGKIAEALDVYTKALGIVDIKNGDKAVILKNRAACHLKEEDYQAVIDDCSAGTVPGLFVLVALFLQMKLEDTSD